MRRAAATILVLAIASLAVVVTIAPLSSSAQTVTPNQVGLVVDFGDSNPFTACIAFDESEQLTGCDILDESALSVTLSDYQLGQAVCKINAVGCPANNCFCECPPMPCEYWAYYHLGPGGWEYSSEGCSSYTVEHGDVEGWAWGPGSLGTGSDVEPPLIAFDELCTEPEVIFTADPEDIVTGQCSELEWSVDNAGAVALDDGLVVQGVGFDDTREVCPTSGRTYTLIVDSAAGLFEYEVSINVTQATATATPTRTATRAPTATQRPTDTRRPAASTATPTTEAITVAPSPTDTPIALLTFVPVPPTATPMRSPTVVAMAPPAVEDAPAPPSEEAAPAEPSPPQGVTLDRILLLIGVGVGTLGFGGLAFIGIILALIVVYVWARGLFAGGQGTEQ